MDGREYEHSVAKYLKKQHYKDIVFTRASGDFGVDLIARKRRKHYAIQCKYYTGRVGVKAVQEAVAGRAFYECDQAMVVTNSTFTRGARQLAEKNDVILVENVQPGMRREIKILLAILSVCYAGFLAYAVCALHDEAEGLGQNAREALIVTRVMQITAPLWVLLLLLLLVRLMKRIAEGRRRVPEYIEELIEDPDIDPAEVPELDIQRILDVTGYDWDSTLACAVADAADSWQFTQAETARSCVLHASEIRRIFDDLESCGFIEELEDGIYTWTARAFIAFRQEKI